MSGVTKKEAAHALALLEVTRDELADILRTGHRAEIVEAGEWRPLADHVAGLVATALAKKERYDNLGGYPESVPPDIMIKTKGKSYRCSCGGNVFRHPKGFPNLYRCNSCGYILEGEPE